MAQQLKADPDFKSNPPSQAFLFSVNTLTASSTPWNLNYSGSVGKRAAGPFGYDGVDQQLSLKGYLGNRFTLLANAAIGFSRMGGTASAQQAEVIRDVIGGKKELGARMGLGFGISRDWDHVNSVFSRFVAAYDAASWKILGNMRFEKAFSSLRDKVDLTTSLGFHHKIAGNLFGGFEMVGEDLEGFWETDEAEGGAKMLLGPSLNLVPAYSKLSFSICGGPVFYATRSNVMPSEAIRDLGANASTGYTIRAVVSYSLR